MRKKCFPIILLLTTAVTLAACASESSSTGTDSSMKASTKQEDTFEKNAGTDPDVSAEQSGESAPEIPVLMGGALPYANMQTLKTENYEDGTYWYEDETEDGMLRITNVSLVNTGQLSQTPEEYGEAAAKTLSDSGTYDNLSAYQDETYTGNLSYPVYLVSFTTGTQEDTRKWLVFMVETDNYTYLYGLSQPADTKDDLQDFGDDLFPRLFLSDAVS